MGPRIRRFVIGSLVAWAVVAAAWVLVLLVESRSSCPSFDDSGPGEAAASDWSWIPPGRECFYAEGPGVHADRPPTARLFALAVLIAWPLATVAAGSAASGDRIEAAARRDDERGDN